VDIRDRKKIRLLLHQKQPEIREHIVAELKA
jgi:hypothetical protein